jgi:hypothetical protein
MLALLLATVILAFLCLTFGIAVANLTRLPMGWSERCFIGLATLNTLATTVSLFLPLNGRILGVFLGLSFALAFYFGAQWKMLVADCWTKRHLILLALPLLLLAWVIAADVPKVYDTGLYHLQAIRWTTEYAAVPGLANLHGRLGFNPNIFTVFALTSLRQVFGQPIFAVNWWVFSVCAFYFLNQLSRHTQDKSKLRFLILDTIFLITILKLAHNLSSPTPDFLATALPIFIFSNAIQRVNDSEPLDASVLWLLGCYVVTVKLAALPILLLPLLMGIGVIHPSIASPPPPQRGAFARRYRGLEREKPSFGGLGGLQYSGGFQYSVGLQYHKQSKKYVHVVFLSLLIVLPWLVRNIILTGWCVYPLAAIDVWNVDWKVPIEQVLREQLAIKGWARSPDEQHLLAAQQPISQWFGHWWQQLNRLDKAFFVLALGCPLLTFVAAMTRRIRLSFSTFAITLTAFVGVLFWWTLAPDVRFGKAFLVMATFSPLLYLPLPHVLGRVSGKYFFNILIALLFLVFLNKNARNSLSNLVNGWTHQMYFPKRIMQPNNVYFDTLHLDRLSVLIPTHDDRCFDQSLPCTPRADSTLELRGKNIQAGFRHRKN